MISSRPTTLVTGAGGELGLALCKSLSLAGHEIHATARNLEKLAASLTAAGVSPASMIACDFTDRESIRAFYDRISKTRFSSIVHVASPWEGRLENSSVADLEGWAGFQFAATLLAKKFVDQDEPAGRLILIGSVAGTMNKTAKSYPLYSAYKGYLRFLAEAARHEAVRAHYVNLGGFRTDGDGAEFLATETVVRRVMCIIDSDTDPGVQVDLMTMKDMARYPDQR